MTEIANELGKVPPQAIELEEIVLGALILEKDSMFEVSDIINSNSFYKNEHVKIYSAINELHENNKAIDMMTVTEQLRKKNQLDEIGGPFKLMELTGKIASSAHIKEHAQIVQEYYIRRELISTSSKINTTAYDLSQNIEDVINEAIASLNKSVEGVSQDNMQPIQLVAKKFIDEIKERENNKGKLIGIPSFNLVNSKFGGWHRGNLIIIGARPSQGKSRIAQELAVIAAQQNQVDVYSIEMPSTEIAGRQFASETNIENRILRRGDLDEIQWGEIWKAIPNIEKLKLSIDDTARLTLNQLITKAHIRKKKYNTDLIIIDYLQLMSNPGYKIREQEIASITRGLKMLAKELNIPIIALSQLSRGIEDRGDKTPKLSDLRESGAIEQDADEVWFIHRPEKYDDDPAYKNLIWMLCEKSRNGPVPIKNELYTSSNWARIYQSIEEKPY